MRDSVTPRWARALSLLLPAAYRAEIVGDLIEERRTLMAGGRSRLSTALWLAAHLLRSAVASRRGGPASTPPLLLNEASMDVHTRHQLLRNIPKEIRHAARSLRRAPAFSAIAFMMIAFGIGATAAMYTVLESVVLRPLPYADPERLVSIMHPTTAPGSGERKWGLSIAGYFEFRREAKSFVDAGVYRTSGYTIVGDGVAAEEVRVGMVTHTLFTTLGARPHLGRLFNVADDTKGAPSTVVLGRAFWERRHGADATILGRTIQTSVGSRLVIGVAEQGLSLPKPGPFASTANLAGFGVDIWEPLRLDPNAPPQNNHAYSGVARLRPGVKATQAEAELSTIVSRFPERFPSAYSARFIKSYNFRVSVTPLHEEVLGPTVARSLWILFAAVGFVLVIACANVANLFMVRAEARSREAGIRAALGAGRAQMAAHYFTESVLLTGAAGLAALGIAFWGVPALIALAPTDIPLLASTSIGWRTVAFTMAVSLGAGLIFGLIPLSRRPATQEALRASGRGMTSSRRQRLVRGGLVIGQVALAVVLLTAAGLLVRSVAALRDVKPGLDSAGVLTFEVALPYDRYRTDEASLQFHRELQERIAALPGVRHVGAASAMPLRDYGTGCIVVFREGRPFGKDERTPCVPADRPTPGFFDALSISVRGRVPTWADVDTRSQAAVITKALADRLWPGEDPIGKGINSNGRSDAPPDQWYRIVGVVPELRAYALDQPAAEVVFYAPTSLGSPSDSGALNEPVYFVKTDLADPLSLLPAVRAIVSEMNSHVPVTRPSRMQDVVDRSMARASFSMLLLGLAAAMAILLSAVGLYGVIAYVVAERRTEIGIRMALGARVAEIGRWVVGQSLALAATGVALGTALAVAVTRVLESFLFHVNPLDPLVFAVAIATLLIVASVASLAPARRAARVDPVEALRN